MQGRVSCGPGGAQCVGQGRAGYRPGDAQCMGRAVGQVMHNLRGGL